MGNLQLLISLRKDPDIEIYLWSHNARHFNPIQHVLC